MPGHFHDDTIGDVAASLQTHADHGISPEEARARLARLGPNAIAEEPGASRWEIVRGQLVSPVVGVLIVAAVLSGVLRQWVDVGVILAIVALNAIVGYLQEYRAERSLELLRKLAAPRARVIRGGMSESVPAHELVPGDLIELEPGDLVPADARLVAASSLRTNESALTGESTPVEKTLAPSADAATSLGDRTCCVYLATSVSGGRGRALVFGTASDTELGKIVTLVKRVEREATTLQKDLAQVGKILLGVCGVAILAVFAAGLVRWLGQSDLAPTPPAEMFLTAVSLAVAAIPEGLPAIVTITLAIGVQRMLRRHVLLRRLASVETLGSASVICTDKTGTITQNAMAVREACGANGAAWVLGPDSTPDDPALRELLGASAACSNVRNDGGGADPLDVALVVAARGAGWSEATFSAEQPRIAEAPFDSERRRMSTLHARANGAAVLYLKGAPEVVLARCTVDRTAAARLDQTALDLANRGMRVLAIARREIARADATADPASFEHDLTFLGFVALADPPRAEAAQAVRECASAGIRTVLLTGDHLGTATAIAREVGIYGDGDRVMTGGELERLTEEELARDVHRVSVYARLAPDQKLKIVRAWKQRGAVVAMTGDGVNDAPALKEADIGIAMGKSGTDVARESADLVITDDRFESIVAAVEEGRAVHANIRRALLCLFAGNLSEVALVGIATALGLPVPLHPRQILWMNFVTDGPPALALATEPVSPDEMRRPPRNRLARILDSATIFSTVFQGFALYLGAMLSLLYFYDGGAGGPGVATQRMQTGVFCTVVLSQMLNCFSFRNDRQSIFSMRMRGNWRLAAAVVASIGLQILIALTVWGRSLFQMSVLESQDFGAILVFSLIPVALVEAWKAWRRARKA